MYQSGWYVGLWSNAEIGEAHCRRRIRRDGGDRERQGNNGEPTC